MHGYEFLNMTLKRIEDHVGYVLVIARGDGKVLLLGTDNARNRLVAINAASPLEHVVRGYRTPFYERICAQLKARFGAYSEDGFGIWFHLDASQLHNAIAEYCLETGARQRLGPDFVVGGRAWVVKVGGGTIKAIDTKGAVVALDRPRGGVSEVIAPRSLLKPYLRAAA